MNPFSRNHPDRPRFIAAVILGVVLVFLAGVRLFERPTRNPVSLDPRAGRTIDSVVDAALLRCGVDPKAGKTREVKAGEVKSLRRESHFEVPPTFVSIVLNHELAASLAPFGGRVIATEHAKEANVTMHIRRDGYIIRTLVLHTAGR
jgi:hypothetical protein